MLTKDEIVNGLVRLGLEPGDVLLVHASFGSLGEVEGGPETIVDALLATVGKTGTVVVPAYSVNRARLPESFAEFDPRTTPTWTGIVAETLRKRPGVVRSWHPSHSMAALGRRAGVITVGLRSLFRYNAKVLLLGVGLESASILHLSEELIQERADLDRVMRFNSKSLTSLLRLVIRRSYWTVQDYLPWLAHAFLRIKCVAASRKRDTRSIPEDGARKWANFGKLMPIFSAEHVLRSITIGNALCHVGEARKMVFRCAEELRKRPEDYYEMRPSRFQTIMSTRGGVSRFP